MAGQVMIGSSEKTDEVFDQFERSLCNAIEHNDLTRYEEIKDVLNQVVGSDERVLDALNEAESVEDFDTSVPGAFPVKKQYYRHPAAALAHALVEENPSGKMPEDQQFYVAGLVNQDEGKPFWSVLLDGMDYGLGTDCLGVFDVESWFEDAWADDAHKLEDDEAEAKPQRRSRRARGPGE